MKNPSQQRLERQKHQLLHEIYKQNNPLLFCEQKPRRKRKHHENLRATIPLQLITLAKL